MTSLFKALFCISSLMLSLSTLAQSLTVVDCSTVLIVPADDINNDALALDTMMDMSLDNLVDSQSDFEIMFIIQVADSALVDQVHINLGLQAGDSSLLSTSFDQSDNNPGTDMLIYECYGNYININVGEFEILNALNYSIQLEEASGTMSTPYTGTITK